MIHLRAPKLADEAGRLAAVRRLGVLDAVANPEFDEIVALITATMGVPAAAITLVAAERLWYVSARGVDPAETPREVAFCDHTIRSNGPLVVEDAARDARFARNPLVAGPSRVRSYLGVPLTTPEGYNVGSVCALGTEPRRFDAAEVETLGRFGRLAVSCLEMRQAARRDALTGALSRGAFDESLGLAAARAGGHGPHGAGRRGAARRGPASLLLLDIDHFKAVNDRWGHPAGDAVIRAVAGAAQGLLRRVDRLGRLGGEEFGALLRDAGPADAVAAAERLRGAVASLRLPEIGGGGVTVSCGVAGWRPDRAAPADWLAAADAALYRAKREGRDRVACAP